MTNLADLDDAQVILLSTLLVADADFAQLEILASERPDILNQTILCRLLISYLPITSETESRLATFLIHLQQNFQNVSTLDLSVDTRQVESLSKLETARRLNQLRLNLISTESPTEADDELSNFVIDYIHLLNSISGLSSQVLEIVDAVADNRPRLRQWSNTYLVPLLSLQGEFYPGRADILNLKILEDLQGYHGVKTLLQFAEEDGGSAHIDRDLDSIVAPWIHGASKCKRRRMSGPTAPQSPEHPTSWRAVSEWLLSTGHTNFPLAAKAVIDWDGPRSENMPPRQSPTDDHGSPERLYAQTALALLLHSPIIDTANAPLFRAMLDRVSTLEGAYKSSQAHDRLLPDSSRADLLDNSSLRPGNPLTTPSVHTLNFFNACLIDQYTLYHTFNIARTVASVVDLTLFGTEEKQKQEVHHLLQQILRTTKLETNWSVIRDALLSLHKTDDAQPDIEQSHTLHALSRVRSDFLETEILDAMLTTDQYTVVNDIYITSNNLPLASTIVQSHIIAAIYSAYDNASNGNRTRGSMKRASDLLRTFQSKFPAIEEFQRIEYLIKATHSLSFYQLTLQHGVPFRPINIRVQRDPLALLESVLKQTPKSYTKLDDLVEIGRNLMRAGLPQTDSDTLEEQGLDEKLFHASHRVIYLAIRAALVDDDFDTAYSYITTRMSTSPLQPSDSQFLDDMSWRAAFEAGRYKPSSSPRNLHDRIASLAKRMDLLSLALTLAPTPHTLPEILEVWTQCETEMDILRARAVDEERAFEAQGDSMIPGGFEPGERELDAAETRRLQERRVMNGTSPSYEEEAPMGLFDVARGAASALRNSTFPLRGHGRGGDGFKIRQAVTPESPRNSTDELGEENGNGQPRVRKRDMVSNMVTGRLVSGMSWVLGAPPSGGRGHEDDDQ